MGARPDPTRTPAAKRGAERSPVRGRERGAVSVELVLATPLLLMLVFGVIQFGLWQHAVHIAVAAAQDGARAARTEQGTATAGQAATQALLDQLGHGQIRDAQVTVTRTPERTRVAILAHTEAIVFGLDLPIRAVADSPTERFRPDLDEAGT